MERERAAMKICGISNEFFTYEHKYDPDYSNINSGVLHSHIDVFEITYIVEGNSDFMIENAIYPVVKDDVLILRPDEMHGVEKEHGGKYERINLYIPIKYFQLCGCGELLDELYDRDAAKDNVINVNTSSYRIKEQFERLDEYAKNGETNNMLLQCVVAELIYMLVKSRGSAHSKAYKNEYVGDIIAYILNNLEKKLALDEIAEHMHINKQYMCTMFKKHTGITINDYIIKKRLQRVMALYRKNNNLLESAIATGFRNYSTFYKAFCRVYDCSPSFAIKHRI